MDEIIQIKCPFCGAVLSVKNIPDIESKNVTCPICKHKYPFSQFKRVTTSNTNDDPETEYPEYPEYPGKEERTRYAYGNKSSGAVARFPMRFFEFSSFLVEAKVHRTTFLFP